MQNGADVKEPSIETLQDWASGLRRVFESGSCVVQHINWAYTYLGFDNPELVAGEPVFNQAIVNMTLASRFRLTELGYDW